MQHSSQKEGKMCNAQERISQAVKCTKEEEAKL
jgi:hypothetical protein